MAAEVPVRIEDFVCSGNLPQDPADRTELLKELAIIEMEYRWHAVRRPSEVLADRPAQGSGSSGSPRCATTSGPLLEEYLERFPELGNDADAFRQLLVTEFDIRQRVGDRPNYPDYRKRFPSLSPAEEESLRQCAIELTEPRIKVFRGGKVVLSCGMARPLTIGRQQRSEPAPVSLISGTELDRLVIASINDRHISRHHVYVDIVAKQRFRVVNLRRKASVWIEPAGQLPAQSECFVENRVSFVSGDLIVRVESSTR